MTRRKRFFLFMLFVYASLNLFLNFGDWEHFGWNAVSFLVGLPLAYFKPNWIPKLRGISRSNPLLYIQAILILIALQLGSALLISTLFWTYREPLSLIINTCVVFFVVHMIDNYPTDDENGFRAGVSRRFQEMMEKYERSYPPQLAPIPS